MISKLPPLRGHPIRILFRKQLFTPAGVAVHAASAIRDRRILLEEPLLADEGALGRVLIHEIFHFAWVRQSNATRRAWEQRLAEELRAGARGELGWSSELRKRALAASEMESRTRRWREYACESFCDTAAWLLSGTRSAESTLAARWRNRRRRWFSNFFPTGQRIAV
ncbi:MAG: hypothetical protein GY953_29745 [bacterium]|nr:hypothetical protein [bacterium]